MEKVGREWQQGAREGRAGGISGSFWTGCSFFPMRNRVLGVCKPSYLWRTFRSVASLVGLQLRGFKDLAQTLASPESKRSLFPLSLSLSLSLSVFISASLLNPLYPTIDVLTYIYLFI
jgi:hypothetical protein